MLCQELGDHAYALEIAGTTIVLDGYTPRTLRRQIAEAPDELLSLPGRRGRESVRKLLEISFSALSPEEQAVFQSFGALFAPGVTAALLATYRRSDVPPVEQALKTLVRRSLAKQKPVADYFYYSLHALTFSFARAKFRATGQDGGMTVAAIQRYVVDYAHDYSRLTSDQVNIIEAAKVAQHENGGALIKIMTALALEGYFDERGCNQEFLRLLEHTIEAVRQKGDGQDDTLHYLLGKCGNAHFNRGDLARAFECYRAALNLAPNNDRRVRLLGVLGKVCSAQGQYTEAETNFTQGYELAKTNNEELALGFVLEQWSDAAGRRRDFESARQFAAEAIEVTSRRKEQDPIRLSYLWLDLGTAEMDIGIRKALTAHQKAYELAKAIHNLPLMAHIHYALAYDYQALDQFDEAQEHFDAARKLWDDLEYTAEAAQITALMKRFGYLKTE